jgi:LysR family glycine cleavage system transcriptional activator
LRVFEAVAAHLSFSAAADALNVTPAAVSQQIKALEGYIQVPLFRRNGRRVEITDEGLELLPAVRAGLEKLESALQQIKHHRRAGPLQITTLSSFLQLWLLPRIRSFRRKSPNIDLRFHTSRELVDFSRTAHHVAIRFGRGNYPNLHCEKILDDWLVPLANPELIKQHGMIERGADLSQYPLLENGDWPWSVWSETDEEAAWLSRAPSIDDTAGLLAAAEEGLGYALASWTMANRALHKGTLRLAGQGTLPYGSAYYFVCPKNFLAIPKVAQFREWILAAAREFPGPGAPDTR